MYQSVSSVTPYGSKWTAQSVGLSESGEGKWENTSALRTVLNGRSRALMKEREGERGVESDWDEER